jgi:holo-[acyl-carrier protein] synthase
MFSADGIGVDIVLVSRIAAQIDKPSFIKRIFTADEVVYAGNGPNKEVRLAARWAAKEAVAKALGCGLGRDLGFLDVEVYHDSHKTPKIRLSDSANEKHNNPNILISLSHDGDYAIAMAFIKNK